MPRFAATSSALAIQASCASVILMLLSPRPSSLKRTMAVARSSSTEYQSGPKRSRYFCANVASPGVRDPLITSWLPGVG